MCTVPVTLARVVSVSRWEVPSYVKVVALPAASRICLTLPCRASVTDVEVVVEDGDRAAGIGDLQLVGRVVVRERVGDAEACGIATTADIEPTVVAGSI